MFRPIALVSYEKPISVPCIPFGLVMKKILSLDDKDLDDMGIHFRNFPEDSFDFADDSDALESLDFEVRERVDNFFTASSDAPDNDGVKTDEIVNPVDETTSDSSNVEPS